MTPFQTAHWVVTPGAGPGDAVATMPDGGAWVDFYDRSVYPGGQVVTRPAPIGRLPLMVRQGARIPVAVPPSGKLPRHDDPVTDMLEF